MTPDRWFGVGFCEGARGAGASAADAALVHDDPKLLIVFCSRAHNLRQLLRGIRERAGDVSLIRCTARGVVVLLSDGLAGAQQEIGRGAHGVLGAAVPLVGGCAGDDLRMSRTFP